MENMRSKITKRFHGRKHTDETKEKMSRSRKGKKHTKETCMKISKAQKINIIQVEKTKANCYK